MAALSERRQSWLISNRIGRTAFRLLDKGHFAILGIGAIALFLPWLSVSGFFAQSVSGFEFDTGKLYLLALIAIAAYSRKYIWISRPNEFTNFPVLALRSSSFLKREFYTESNENTPTCRTK